MPADVQPGADDVGSPDDGRGQARPRRIGNHCSGWCLTNQCSRCTFAPCPHDCHQGTLPPERGIA